MSEGEKLMRYKKLGSFSKIRRGASPRPIDDPKFFGGSVGWVRIADVTASKKYLKNTTQYVSELGERNSVRVDRGDLIMSICGTVGKPMIVDIPACIHDGFVQVYDLENADKEFIYYSLQFSEESLKAKGQSGTQTNLNTSIVADLEIFYPSLEEQSSIAAILSCMDHAIDQSETLIAKLQRIKAGLMQDLLTKGIDKNGDIRSEETHEFKNSPLGKIPKDWEVIKVEQAGSVQLGRQRSPKHQSGRYAMPYLRVANVFDGWIDYSDVLSMDFTPNERITFGLLPGDILLNEGQSIELVGRSAIYEGKPEQYCFQNTLIRFRPYQDNDAGYCQSVFKFWLDTGRFMDVARQTTSVAHLGADRFAQMAFPRPEPEEQQQIFQRLKAQNEAIESERLDLNKMKRIKIGLMQDLLTGKVPVDSLLSAQSFTGNGTKG